MSVLLAIAYRASHACQQEAKRGGGMSIEILVLATHVLKRPFQLGRLA